MRSVEKAEISRRRAALKRFLKQRGLKVKPWCERAKVPPTAVYNFLNGGSNSLTDETYQKLADAEKVHPLLLKEELPLARITYAIKVIGAVQAGVWCEAMSWEREQQFTVMASVPERYSRKSFGLQMVGPSMNRFYPEGSIAICVSIHDFHRDLKDEDHVVVQRIRADGKIEATVKELKIDDAGKAWLWPRSTDPRFQQPLSLEDPNGEAVEVQVTAIVIGSFSPRPNID